MRIWFTRRALLLHLVIVVVFPGFMALAWWQYHQAMAGNALSWAYTFEWPFFAGYAVFIWWKLVHDQDHRQLVPALMGKPAQRAVGWALGSPRSRSQRPAPAQADADAPQRARSPQSKRLTVAQMAALALAEASATPHSAGTAASSAVTGASQPGTAAGAASMPATAVARAGPFLADSDTAGACAAAGGTDRTAPDMVGIATGGHGTADTEGDVLALRPKIPTLDDPDLSEEDRELAEYNAYLAALSASGRRKRW